MFVLNEKLSVNKKQKLHCLFCFVFFLCVCAALVQWKILEKWMFPWHACSLSAPPPWPTVLRVIILLTRLLVYFSQCCLILHAFQISIASREVYTKHHLDISCTSVDIRLAQRVQIAHITRFKVKGYIHESFFDPLFPSTFRSNRFININITMLRLRDRVHVRGLHVTWRSTSPATACACVRKKCRDGLTTRLARFNSRDGNDRYAQL